MYSKICFHSKNPYLYLLICLTLSIKCGRHCLPEFSLRNIFRMPYSLKYARSMLQDTLRAYGVTLNSRRIFWGVLSMLFTYKTISWAWIPLLGVTSREALYISSFLAHIACVGPKFYPLFHIREALQNRIIYLVLFFLNPHQYFIETYHGFNQILRTDLLSSPILFGLSIFILNMFS